MNPSCLIHLILDNLIAQCAYNALLRKVRAARCELRTANAAS